MTESCESRQRTPCSGMSRKLGTNHGDAETSRRSAGKDAPGETAGRGLPGSKVGTPDTSDGDAETSRRRGGEGRTDWTPPQVTQRAEVASLSCLCSRSLSEAPTSREIFLT
jgi:hypothetical protein